MASEGLVFVHISKAGGSNFYNQFFTAYTQKYAPRRYWKEHGLAYSKHVWPFQQQLTMVRGSPRQHLWSMYGECRYTKWGLRITRDLEFPRTGSATDGFERWTRHFCTDLQGAHTDPSWRYGCYHPSNYQTRALTSNSSEPHGIEEDPAAPNAKLAVDALRHNLSWFGVTEFFDASVCLFMGAIAGSPPEAPLPENISAYVDQKCRCDDGSRGRGSASSGSASSSSIANYVSHIPVKAAFPHALDSAGANELGAAGQTCLEKLTATDTKMVRHAVQIFLKRIVLFEQKLGRRVLCDNVLQKQQPLMTDTFDNVTQLYYASKAYWEKLSK